MNESAIYNKLRMSTYAFTYAYIIRISAFICFAEIARYSIIGTYHLETLRRL